MHKQNRTPKPDCNDINYKEFRDCVKPFLLLISGNHCSYCDEYFYNSGNLVVEHFQNKKDYPELEYVWENLFVACNSCNAHKRDNKYSEIPKPIKPDEPDYFFDKYFHLDSYSGKLIAKKDNDRAKATINFLNLNNDDVTEARLLFINKLIENNEQVFEDSFRFITDYL